MSSPQQYIRPATVWLFLVLSLPWQPLHAQTVTEARTAFRSGRYNDAIAMFSRVTRRQTSSAEAARGLVAALVEVGRYEDAQQAAQRFSRGNPNSAELANALGEVLYLRGDREGAEDAFRRASGAASDSLLARYNLAAQHYESGAIEAARREFDRFIDVYNRGEGLTAAELRAVAGAVRYLSLQDWQLAQDALRAYDEAIAADPGDLEPQVWVGELFLERYRFDLAEETFAAILEQSPGHPRALLGLARTFKSAGMPGAFDTAERALEVNPNLVAARVFLAQLLLESEDYQRALVELERALDVNPTSLEALSVLAAARFLQGDEAGFAAAERQVLQLNPRYGGLYNTLAEACVRTRLYAEAVEFAQRAVELDPTSWRGFTLLGINQMRTGRMRAGRENLETAFEGDPHDPWTKNTLDLLDTLVQYTETSTERFNFAMDAGEAGLLSLYFGELAEEAYDSLAAKYGFRAATPVRVEVFPNHEDFSVRTVGLTGLGALGVSFGPVVAMDSPSARETGDFNWGSTLWHELAHTFHMGISDHRVPRWFTEGLAVYEERRARPGWGDDVNPGFLVAYLQGRLVPVSKLNDGFMRPAYPEQIGHSYYQASLVCELIEREHGFQTLVELLEEFGAGRSITSAFESVLAMDIEEFDTVFDDYLQERFAGPLAALRSTASSDDPPHRSREEIADRARRQPDDFVAQLAMGTLLVEQGRPHEAIGYLEQAKSLFPEYAGDDSPYWHLARIYKEQGGLERAAAELDHLTAINERNYAARMELAELREALNDRRGAAAALQQAVYIDPMGIDLHLKLAELYAGLSEWTRAIRERKAVLALNPVDRAEAQYQLARVYFDAGDIENARRAVLRALEDAPNFQKAQDLLLEIHSRIETGNGNQVRRL
ncbi:MAG: tetratricopeptide repeat protein [Gemmatimonadota bacterium]|nr:MAG: tetratricopeptide repeat protein [Gemmatimonadota bacterium]